MHPVYATGDVPMTEGIRTTRPAIGPRFRLLLLFTAFFALWTGLPAGYSHSSVYSFDWQHELTPAGSIYASAAINHILSDGTLIISAGNPSPPSSSGQVLAF